MASTTDQYCIKWNDFYSHLGSFFSVLYQSEQLADVTLCAEDTIFKCHKVVLSAGSPYFQVLLTSTTTEHPIIILAGMKALDIQIIIDFMYHGEMKNVDYEQFISVLKTAELLKINGLTDVTIFHSAGQTVEDNPSDTKQDNIVLIDDNIYSSVEESEITDKNADNDYASGSEQDILEKKKKFKDFKKYSEGNVDRALKDMEWGMPLMEASRIHNVPRSTLYSKAKLHSGLQIVSRKEHSNQDCHPALQAIADGMSLKRASEEFNIPKTVLWRRVQKRLDILSKVKCRKKRGGKQRRESEFDSKNEFNKTDSHNETKSDYKMENNSPLEDENEKSLKKVRLSQAVAACKLGKMSQATASTTFQVPKTTIWRRLQKYSSQEEIKPKIVIEKEDHEYTLPDCYEISSEKYSEMKINEFPSSDSVKKSVIILHPNNLTENLSTFENCVEIKTEEDNANSNNDMEVILEPGIIK